MRLAIVDIARGIAILQMIAYHLCYDLNYFGYIHVAMTHDPGWIAWRTAIVAQFLLLVGVSIVLRERAAPVDSRRSAAYAMRYWRFWRRWLQIALCAAAVSVASAYLFHARFIWFGVLHFVALALLLAVPLQGLGRWNLLLGCAAIAAGVGVHLPQFSADTLSWIGFSPIKPHTEDFVPVFPWFGVVLIGMGLAWVWQSGKGPLPRALRAYTGRYLGVLRLLGRWPLTVYMVHQPLLFLGFQALASAPH
jgi:uncharacterized membrane protein